MITISYVEFKSFYGVTTKNLFFTHNTKSHSLVVLFPGRGYTCDKPLLYYANMAALNKGCDVLNLEYGFHRANTKFQYAEDSTKIIDECEAIISKCELNTYSNVYFISKSLGTLFAGELSVRMGEYNIKNLFLTPLVDTIPYMVNTNCIAVTGSKDDSFPDSSVDFVRNKSNNEIIIINNADHSLETEIGTGTAVNLEILQQIVKLCEDFVS